MHEEIQDLLEDYVDERLDRDARKMVDDHLKTCTECRAILDDVAPVELSAMGVGRFDERLMRRTVRRSMFRSAMNTALLLLAGFIVVWFLSALVVHPLLINRGGRAADIARARIDTITMTNPGAVLESGTIDSSLLSKDLHLRFAVPVGSSVEHTFGQSASIGIFGLIESFDRPDELPGYLASFGQEETIDQLTNLGAGTVATALVQFDEPMSVDDAQRIADDPGSDIRVIWSGFDATLDRDEPPFWTAAGTIGYGTCQDAELSFDDSVLGATSASFSQGSIYARSSITAALDSVRRGLDNIASRPELVEDLLSRGDSSADFDAVRAGLTSDPMVRVLVVTGPSPEIADFLDLQSDQLINANVMAVDFYNWTAGICGR